MLAVRQSDALEILASKHSVSPSLALGLGACLYFEYLRRPRISPTHFISALRRDTEKNFAARKQLFVLDAHTTCRDALRENALWFNLDRAPTTALLGMEMLAEELPYFEAIADWRECLTDIAQTILETRALYRQSYVEFLDEITPHVPDAHSLAAELRGIADEWNAFAEDSRAAVDDSSQLERASRRLRRIAFREEHFWGSVLDL